MSFIHRVRAIAAISPRVSAFILGLSPLAACAQDDGPTAPAVAPLPAARSAAPTESFAGIDRPAPITRFVLESAARGLLYTSESDYPFTYFFHAGPVPTPITIPAFRRALAIPASTPVETISLDEFFARHIERVDPADSAAVALVPRYVLLRETIRYSVRGAQVFRVGTIAIDCYAVGTDPKGNIVGLRTIAIET